jgi:hypothetical protein
MPHPHVKYFLVGLLALGGLTSVLALAADIAVTGPETTTQDNEGSGNVTVTESGSITTTTRPFSFGITTTGDNITITNAGSISTTGDGSYGIIAQGDNSTITNAGTIITSGTISIEGEGSYGIAAVGANITITNAGTITAGVSGIGTEGIINALTNSGMISAGFGGNGIYNYGGIIRSLTNSGMISAGVVGNGIYNYGGVIGSLTNSGTISAGAGGYGIYNDSVVAIATLNNAQGGNSTSPATTALTYKGNLPTNYNIIINSANHYGQLAVTDPGDAAITNFGIYGAPLITSRGFASVLSGTALPTGTSSGAYDNMTWSLVANGGAYDLVFSGVSLMGTQQSLVNTASALQNTYTLQNAVLTNSFSYDCSVFGTHNVCISAGGRDTAVSAANGLNGTSALLIAAYRLNQNNTRIGVYADQSLSVNNARPMLSLRNNTPLIGLFGVWSQRPDGIGAEVKVSAAYGQKSARVNRQVVGLSEPGSGLTNLNSQGAQITAKYGFAVAPDVLVSPYVGMRYTQNNMGGYTETASSSVTAPLTYSALNTNATTASAGVGASYRFMPKATVFASAGVETDINTSNGTYSATGVSGLTPVNFNPNPSKTRPTATVGAYFDIEKNQRLGIIGIYRQEPFQSISTTTVFATYTIGL